MWSKKAVGRCGNGVSDQAKLNSPKPTPSHGCMAISDSVLAQMPKRELEMSPSAVSRAAPPKTWWLSCAQAVTPPQHSAYTTGASSSSTRTARGRCRSSAPHSASTNTPRVPVRDALSTNPSMNKLPSSAATSRRRRPASTSQTTATADHSNRLLRWLGWRRLPLARPGIALAAIQLPSAHCGANTCTTPTPALSTPATTSAMQKARYA